MKIKMLFVVLLLTFIVGLFNLSFTQSTHAATVSHVGSVSSLAVRPDIAPIACSPDNTYYVVWLQHPDGSVAACYSGTGYTGVHVQNVSYINPHGVWGWYRYYDSSGGHWLNDGGGYGYSFNTPVLVTQICNFCSAHS